jgi:hypothetical protein
MIKEIKKFHNALLYSVILKMISSQIASSTLRSGISGTNFCSGSWTLKSKTPASLEIELKRQKKSKKAWNRPQMLHKT